MVLPHCGKESLLSAFRQKFLWTACHSQGLFERMNLPKIRLSFINSHLLIGTLFLSISNLRFMSSLFIEILSCSFHLRISEKIFLFSQLSFTVKDYEIKIRILNRKMISPFLTIEPSFNQYFFYGLLLGIKEIVCWWVRLSWEPVIKLVR